MILKVMDHGSNDPNMPNQCWIYDDVTRVILTNGILKKDWESYDANLVILDPKTNAEDKVGCVKFLRGGSLECSIVFDTVAFLCNDEGKTLECIPGKDL